MTIINHTANTFANLSVDLKDGDGDCFTINGPLKKMLNSYETTTFTVVPKHDLTGGVYKARYQLNYDGGESSDFVFTINVEDRDWNYLSGLIYLDVENKDDYDYMKLITVTLTPDGEEEPVITRSFVGFDAQTYNISNITPGIYTLKAEHEGSISYVQTVDITSDAEQNIYMPLTGSDGNTLFGYVSYFGSENSPVVFSYKKTAGGQAQTREFSTDAHSSNYTNGQLSLKYCIEGLGYAEYAVVISKAGHVDRRVVVSVKSDTTLTTSLNKTNDITGDGKTDIADYSACVNYALSANSQVSNNQTDDIEYEKHIADYDGDGYIDVIDVSLLEMKINSDIAE